MQIWMTLILAVQLLSALAMIGLVLIQHGKGADMGASFGSGASGSLFGATGSANFLSRSTAALATVFFVCTLALTYLNNTAAGRSAASTGSVLDRAAPAASAPASAPATGAIPGAAPAAIATTAAPATSAVPAPAAEPASTAASAAQK
jgi:preprotein translocase subunit SecG